MGNRRIIYECDSCHKEYQDADYNNRRNRALINFEVQYYNESLGQRTRFDTVRLCPDCWFKMNKFLKEELNINLNSNSI